MARLKVLISASLIILIFAIGILSFFVPGDLSDWLTGRSITRVFVHESFPINCSVNLSEGLNLVSFPCETEQYDFYRAFSDINNETLNFDSVFVFDSRFGADPWHSFKEDLPNFTIQHEPSRLDRRVGYFIFMDEAGTYRAEGLRFPTSNIQLREGWNLVGYPSANTKNISEVLESIENDYISVHSYQLVNGSKQWLHHFKGLGGTLNYFVSGYGYWIHMNKTAVWGLEW